MPRHVRIGSCSKPHRPQAERPRIGSEDMPAARSIARPIAVALASILIADVLLDGALATEARERSFVVAQTSLGGPEQLPPSIAPTQPSGSPPASPPRSDYL